MSVAIQSFAGVPAHTDTTATTRAPDTAALRGPQPLVGTPESKVLSSNNVNLAKSQARSFLARSGFDMTNVQRKSVSSTSQIGNIGSNGRSILDTPEMERMR